MPKFLISAGEASGELYGALLMEALGRREPASDFFGLGGERMRAAGCRMVVEAKDVAVVGLGEVVSHLPRIWREFHRLLSAVDREKPDGAILIDFPDFNFRLARQLHKRGIPVIYYVSPQMWAWRPGRVKLVKRYVRKMLVIFPFERGWYDERGVDVEFVGHPLADLSPPPNPAIERDMRANDIEFSIAVLPGSRNKEVMMNLPTMLEAVGMIAGKKGIDIPVASTVDGSLVDRIVQDCHGRQVARIRNGAHEHTCSTGINSDARSTLAHARAAIVASGTATVEAALIGTPFVMVYRVSPLSWALGRRFVDVPFFAMPNLIAGRQVVPELVQSAFTPNRVASELNKILRDGPARDQMMAGLAEVRAKLRSGGVGGQTASDRAAEAVLAAIAAAKS